MSMKIMKTAPLVVAITLAGVLGIYLPAAKAAKKDDLNMLPIKPTRVIEFTTTEGSSMSLDVSPDGKSIVFDLLGDIYTIPVEGGTAKRLTSGMAMDQMPRYSPDGSRIAFASDRSGMANLYTMKTDGSDIRRVSNYTVPFDPESPTNFVSLDWSRDSRSLLATTATSARFVRFLVATGGEETYRRYRYPTHGYAVTPDGSEVWATGASDRTTVERQELVSGRVIDRFGMAGDTKIPMTVVSPVISPDGRWLVYRSVGYTHTPVLRNLNQIRVRALSSRASLTEDMVLVEKAGSGANPWHRHALQVAFTPDSRFLVYSAQGKLRKVDIATREIHDIPFTAQVRMELGPMVPVPKLDLSGPLHVKQMRSMNSTSDGRQVVFNALGKIWTQIKGQKPKRLTKSEAREYDPVLSPDGQWIAYVTWSFVEGGKLWKMPARGGTPVELAASPDAFGTPRWLPDGSQVVALRIKSPSMNGVSSTGGMLVRVAASGGPLKEIAKANAGPLSYDQHYPLLTVSADGSRVYFIDGEKEPPALCSVRLDGTDRTVHAQFNIVNGTMAPSPDGKWLALQSAFNTYVMPFPEKKAGDSVPFITLKGLNPEPAARQLSTAGGAQPMWSADGKWLSYSWANKLYRLSYEAATSRSGSIEPEVTTIELAVPRHAPNGPPILLSNARVITMAASGSLTYEQGKGEPQTTDPKVIERGDILIEGMRIKSVGPVGSLKVPANARLVDLTGKTVVPGYFATHEHTFGGRAGALMPEESPQYASFLANGVTTTQDPWYGYSATYADEMIEAGELTGHRRVGGLAGTTPRLGSDEIIAAGEDLIRSQAHADALVRKHKAYGAFLIKEYGQPHRIQHQWLAIAARRHGVKLTSDHQAGYGRIGQVLDGWTAFEHLAPFGSEDIADVDTLVLRSGIVVPADPTGAGESYRASQTTVDRLIAFTERRWPEPASAERWVHHFKRDYPAGIAKTPDSLTEYELGFAADMKTLVRRGRYVTLGTDSDVGYLSIHLNLWQQVRMGLTTAEALRLLTINGARSLGMESDLGSIEVGKIADLVVLNSNPLDEITNTIDIRYVIKIGEVYDPKTLDVLWPTPRKFKMFPWAAKTGETTVGAKSIRR